MELSFFGVLSQFQAWLSPQNAQAFDAKNGMRNAKERLPGTRCGGGGEIDVTG